MEIAWTNHARRRLIEWSKTRGVTQEKVEAVARQPEQIVTGHADLYVAQARIDNGLLRVPFFEVEGVRTIVTVYWTSRIHRYWET